MSREERFATRGPYPDPTHPGRYTVIVSERGKKHYVQGLSPEEATEKADQLIDALAEPTEREED